MHPAVAALSFDEKGLVLGALLTRMPAEAAAARLAGRAGAHCRAALEALGAENRAARAGALASLLALVRAPLPAGLELVHPGWLRERLAAQPSAVVQAVAAVLPAEAQRVTAALLRERVEADRLTIVDHHDASTAGAAELARAIFAGLVPLSGPGAPAGELARSLLAMPFDDLEAAIEARGAETLGISLRAAPGPLVARAAAGLGEALARTLLDAAAAPGPPEARDAARAHVVRAAADKPADLAAYLGARALAAALAPEGPDAVRAVAQRLCPALGRRLLDFGLEAAG